MPIVSRSPVPFYGPSIAFTDHSYRLQVTCTFLRTIYSFYRSFLSSPGHLYLFTDHTYFYRSFLSSPGHLYLLRTIHSFHKSLLSSSGHLYLFTDYSLLLQILSIVSRSPVPFHGPYILLQIIPIVSRSPVPFNVLSTAFTDHSYRLQVSCTFLRTIHSFCRSFLSSPGHPYLFTDHP